jgi:hypothetical protein
MRSVGQSVRSQQQARALLAVALCGAEDSNLISVNPVRKVRNPQGVGKVLTPLKIEEVMRLLKTYQGTFLSARLHVSLIIDYTQSILPSKFTIAPIQMTSEFPHGYSLSMGRTLFYYSEYIANQILTSSMANQMDILLTNKVTNGEQVIDFKFDSLISEEKIKSMVLDIFDFDFEGFNKRLESYDLCDDIKKPTESKPWLVKDKHPNDLLVL